MNPNGRIRRLEADVERLAAETVPSAVMPRWDLETLLSLQPEEQARLEREILDNPNPAAPPVLRRLLLLPGDELRHRCRETLGVDDAALLTAEGFRARVEALAGERCDG